MVKIMSPWGSMGKLDAEREKTIRNRHNIPH